MALIDSNNFITHLVWSGLIDKATCGELKEAIELCTVKDIYTKSDMVAMLENLDLQIDESAAYNLEVAKVQRLIRDKINDLKKEKVMQAPDMSDGIADLMLYKFKKYLGSVSREIQNRRLKMGAYETDGMYNMPVVNTNCLESIEMAIAFDVRYWGEERRSAWIYGIVFGYDKDAEQEMKRRFHWTNEDLDRLRRYHEEWKTLKVMKGKEK